jgi:hypothetical protein
MNKKKIVFNEILATTILDERLNIFRLFSKNSILKTYKVLSFDLKKSFRSLILKDGGNPFVGANLRLRNCNHELKSNLINPFFRLLSEPAKSIGLLYFQSSGLATKRAITGFWQMKKISFSLFFLSAHNCPNKHPNKKCI